LISICSFSLLPICFRPVDVGFRVKSVECSPLLSVILNLRCMLEDILTVVDYPLLEFIILQPVFIEVHLLELELELLIFSLRNFMALPWENFELIEQLNLESSLSTPERQEFTPPIVVLLLLTEVVDYPEEFLEVYF
jgi:hypothetical protein